MIRMILCIVTALSFNVQPQTFDWVKIHTTNIVTNPIYLSTVIAIDNSGNPASAHITNSRLIYGALYLGDFVIIKRTSSGETIWENNITGLASVSQIGFDSMGNLIGMGEFRDSVLFNQVLLTTNFVNTEGFVFKLDPSGNLVWFKKVSQMSTNMMDEYNMTVNADGSFWVSSSSYEGYSTLKKFNGSGINEAVITQSNVRYISSSAVDPSGNLWVSGSTFGGTYSFNGFNASSPFSYTEYLVKYNSQGQCQWVQFIQDITLQKFHIVTDDEGSGFLSGSLFVGTQFGNLQANASRQNDYFITKIDADGNFIWLRELPEGNYSGDAATDNGNFLSYSGDGFLYMSGFFRNTIDFGNGIIISSYGSNDILVLKYNTSGDLIWAKKAGGISEETGHSVITDNSGNCYLSGRTRNLAQFDSITVTGSQTNTFLAKISDGIIPVELISFTGLYNKGKVLLKWSTSTEKNNMGFEIERSNSNTAWYKIGFVEGNGTSSENNNYSFDDSFIQGDIYRYRLKQMDYDGGFTYSGIVEVDASVPVSFKLNQNYPNPFNPSTNISFSLPKPEYVTLKLYNTLGEDIKTLVNSHFDAGEHKISFDASELSSGIYFYRITAGEYTAVMKMQVLK